MKLSAEIRADIGRICSSYQLDETDLCVVGGTVLAVHGLRTHRNDVDVVLRPSARTKLVQRLNGGRRSEGATLPLSEHVQCLAQKYGGLGITDADLFTDTKYSRVVAGVRVARLEIEMAYKIRRDWAKDRVDVALIRQYIGRGEEWDWTLIEIPQGGRKAVAPAGRPSMQTSLVRIADAFQRPGRTIRRLLARPLVRLGNAVASQELANQLIHKMSTASLVGNCIRKGHFVRRDLIVRLLTASEIDCDYDGPATAIYRDMQLKRAGLDSYASFRQLISDIRTVGFSSGCPIVVNATGEPLDGCHRLACAMHFGIEEVPVRISPSRRDVTYDASWFEEHGFSQPQRDLIDRAVDRVSLEWGAYFMVILWPPAAAHFDEITEMVQRWGKVMWRRDVSLDADSFERFARNVYSIDDIDWWKVEKKLAAMAHFEPRIRLVAVKLLEPRFRRKGRTGSYLSAAGAEMKRAIRSAFEHRVDGYVYDIICHTGDNHVHNRQMYRLIESYSAHARVEE